MSRAPVRPPDARLRHPADGDGDARHLRAEAGAGVVGEGADSRRRAEQAIRDRRRVMIARLPGRPRGARIAQTQMQKAARVGGDAGQGAPPARSHARRRTRPAAARPNGQQPPAAEAAQTGHGESVARHGRHTSKNIARLLPGNPSDRLCIEPSSAKAVDPIKSGMRSVAAPRAPDKSPTRAPTSPVRSCGGEDPARRSLKLSGFRRNWRAHGDSNPGFRRERATSWTARRWARGCAWQRRRVL